MSDGNDHRCQEEKERPKDDTRSVLHDTGHGDPRMAACGMWVRSVPRGVKVSILVSNDNDK